MSALTEANREHFNQSADAYDSKPWMKTISQQIGQALLERKDWVGVRWYRPGEIGGREVKLLDYACGTGSITKALGPLVTKIVGIDVSENMVQRYNAEAAAAGLKPEEVRAEVGNLLADDVPASLKTAEFYNFDLVVVGLGFHHFENPLSAIKRLTERLKPETGVLMIIDFLPFENDHNQGASGATIQHAGFEKANLQKLHEAASMQNFSFSVVDEPAIMELQEGTQKRKLFITRAKRAPTAWGKMANWVHALQLSAGDQMRVTPRGEVSSHLGITGQNNQAREDNWQEERFKKNT